MAETRSGLFTLQEFSYRRNTLKIAPDAYVVINGALTSRVVSPMQEKGYQDIDVRGGITSINVNAAVSPPGASRATIEVIAPTYRGLHEDYYITLPSGARIPFFTPMMEVKIYMKGRYLESEYGYVPQYYPVFWGMITGVQENYSGGNYTFSLTCEDFLVWWRYQKVTLNPSVSDYFFGGAINNRFPTVFERMSSWEIIYALFSDTFFIQHNADGTEAFFNFVYPKWSNIAHIPTAAIARKENFSSMASVIVDYWNNRFGVGVSNEGSSRQVKDDLNNVPLEMYGLRGPIKQESVKNSLLTFLDPKTGFRGAQANKRAELDLDFSLLARVQPYGLFSNYGDNAETSMFSKLEIATNVCEKVFMEFFVDTNGAFVFKPPFYNMDVSSEDITYYKISPDDIINLNSSFDSNAVVNYMTVYGPLHQGLSAEFTGFYADFDSIRKYGIRSEQLRVPYAMNGKQLNMVAAAECTKRNSLAFTGSISIPLRPEMRLGYPVYIEHKDVFFYMTGITHSLTFGSTATTTLSLQARRDKVFEDGKTGLAGSTVGDVLTACVMRDRGVEIENKLKIALDSQKKNIKAIENIREEIESLKSDAVIKKTAELDNLINEMNKSLIEKRKNIYSGPGLLGTWRIEKAKQRVPILDDIVTYGSLLYSVSNELLMITEDSIPYTDLNGYRHIGAFPYGANTVLSKGGNLIDMMGYDGKLNNSVDKQKNATGNPDVISSSNRTDVGEEEVTSIEKFVQLQTNNELPDEYEKKLISEVVQKREDLINSGKQQRNEQYDPNIFNNNIEREGLAKSDKVDLAVVNQLNINIKESEACLTHEEVQNPTKVK